MLRVRQLAGRLVSVSVLGIELPFLVLFAALASALSVITSRVADWNAMTDELVYERLAISVGQWHSLLPRLHGELVRSLAQLYPALISPWFWRGYVPGDLKDAHIFNAWLMSSACIPAFLLARRVTARRWPAYALGVLTVCTPWIIYSTTLLTEVAAYPAFLWASLAMHKAVSSPSRRNDLLAVLALAVAFFARTQFLLLTGVLPIALAVYHLTAPRGGSWRERIRPAVRDLVRGHPILVGAYLLLSGGVIAYETTGGGLFYLSVYGTQASPNLIPHGTAGSITGHVADLAFGMGILPFVVGAAWLLANAVRPPPTDELRAFACIGAATVVVLVTAISAWDLKIGPFVLDRYLYYLVPLLLLAFLCALIDRRRPRWSLLIPVILVSVGFATHLQGQFLWVDLYPLSTDSPISWLYKPIAQLGGGRSGASTILVIATIVVAALFVLGDRLLPYGRFAAALAILVLIALPADTGYTFATLFSRPGHSSRPLTRSESGILDWLDRTVGTGARVTEVPYPISSSFLVDLQFWRDLEFWNKSVRYDVHYPTPDVYDDAVIWFPNTHLSFDPETGIASNSWTHYVVQSVGDTRFRISGNAQIQRTDVVLIDADQPWRTYWLTFGLYDDGWTRPGTAARIRVFATPGQRGAVTRTLSLQIRTPAEVSKQPFQIQTNLATLHGEATNGGTAFEQIAVCVPAHGFAEARFTTPTASTIPGDLKSNADSKLSRRGGLLIADLSLADEVGAACHIR